MKTERTTYAINGIGPAGKSPRDYLRERALKQARLFASAARKSTDDDGDFSSRIAELKTAGY